MLMSFTRPLHGPLSVAAPPNSIAEIGVENVGGRLMQRSSKIIYAQFLIYAFVGGLSFLIELTSFQMMLFIHIPLILASVASFIFANVANYFISLKVAFVGGRFSLSVELLRLSLVVLIGLALNTLIVVGLVDGLDMIPAVAKILTLPVVLVWNFIGRSLLVFYPDKLPAAIASTFLNED
jgi:putative flippase GtrA